MTFPDHPPPNPQPGRPLRREEFAFIESARIGRLATVSTDHRPSVVPICFALLGEAAPVIVSVLDEKPKRVTDERLGRMRNIASNPAVCLVVDRYDEDWMRLAFVQVRGVARVVMPGGDGHAEAIAALRAKYPQYRAMSIDDRPVITIDQLSAFSWRGDGTRFE